MKFTIIKFCISFCVTLVIAVVLLLIGDRVFKNSIGFIFWVGWTSCVVFNLIEKIIDSKYLRQ